MDKSLDEIIRDNGELLRPRGLGKTRRNDRVSKPYSRSPSSSSSRYSRNSSSYRPKAIPITIVHLSNLHYELTEPDLTSLFSKIGSVKWCKIRYDQSGRSEGQAWLKFEKEQDARESVKQFDGKKAAGVRIEVRLDYERSEREYDDERREVEESTRELGSRFAPRIDRGDRGSRSDDDDDSRRSDSYRPYNRERRPARRDRDERSFHPRREERGGRRSVRRPDSTLEPSTSSKYRPKKTLEELDAELSNYMASSNPDNSSTTTSVENGILAQEQKSEILQAAPVADPDRMME
ncbi:RNA-binding domain-containing protein [Nadsonia fulvescens var. elongata DSM 6958]|uniref:RNA-binding domain-containing protein n=1 Tax=Nadsonia fulvescens var. elongata DSM 6958 TaxID=857566 RepID=A0A1E3PGE6_9ASCO|nr:RNA-binding domain-containing protein [Nadsonia fulvescens var. elongata DSM 6958]